DAEKRYKNCSRIQPVENGERVRLAEHFAARITVIIHFGDVASSPVPVGATPTGATETGRAPSLRAHHLHQILNLAVDLIGTADGLGNFLAKDFTVTLAHPMSSHSEVHHRH